MFFALALVLATPQQPLALHTALPAATELYSEICRLDTGGIRGSIYQDGDRADLLVELLAERGSAPSVSCRDHLCELSALVRLGAISVAVEAGVFRRAPRGPLQLHTIRIRGPEALLENARAHAGCP